jgi:SAM-dependent methyltransferase
MYADRNEALFARLYLERIVPQAEAAGIRPPATVLDAGCQSGRLTVPLAKRGFRVTGIDTSGFGLRRARAHAKAAGVQAEFIQGDITGTLQRSPRQFDLVVCTEVVYLSREFRQMLRALADSVRPGGLLCVSHRPQSYYVAEALRLSDQATADAVRSSGDGRFRDSEYYNWQTEPELRELYAGLGLVWRAAHPIDVTAWRAGTAPGELPPEAQDAWLAAELAASRDGAGTVGRYHLVIAEKPLSK